MDAFDAPSTFKGRATKVMGSRGAPADGHEARGGGDDVARGAGNVKLTHPVVARISFLSPGVLGVALSQRNTAHES